MFKVHSFKMSALLVLSFVLLAGFSSATQADTGITPMVKGGNYHSVALKTDGTVWAWGYNYYGQLGDGTYTDRSTPAQVSNLTDVKAISTLSSHALALKSDGTVWAWGYNYFGQLGDNTTTNRNTPVQVQNLTNVVAVAAGGSHSLALKSDGTVWAWGNNYSGQLGDNSTTNRSLPVQVPICPVFPLFMPVPLIPWPSNTTAAFGPGVLIIMDNSATVLR
jgi:alpha-tubulin suppressor-like RCC1 family protein